MRSVSRFLDKDSSGVIDVTEVDKAIREFRQLSRDMPSIGTGPMTVIDRSEIERLAKRSFSDMLASRSTNDHRGSGTKPRAGAQNENALQSIGEESSPGLAEETDDGQPQTGVDATTPLDGTPTEDDGPLKSDDGAHRGDDGALQEGVGARKGDDEAQKEDNGTRRGDDGAPTGDDGSHKGDDGAREGGDEARSRDGGTRNRDDGGRNRDDGTPNRDDGGRKENGARQGGGGRGKESESAETVSVSEILVAFEEAFRQFKASSIKEEPAAARWYPVAQPPTDAHYEQVSCCCGCCCGEWAWSVLTHLLCTTKMIPHSFGVVCPHKTCVPL